VWQKLTDVSAVLAASIIRIISVLMTEAVSASETSVNFHQSTRRYNPEDSHLHTRRRNNLKSSLFSNANITFKNN
jgi:Na+/phosphate symporter